MLITDDGCVHAANPVNELSFYFVLLLSLREFVFPSLAFARLPCRFGTQLRHDTLLRVSATPATCTQIHR